MTMGQDVQVWQVVLGAHVPGLSSSRHWAPVCQQYQADLNPSGSLLHTVTQVQVLFVPAEC